MIEYRQDKDYTIEDFIKSINAARLECKNKWFVFECYVEGQHFISKMFNTSSQIVRINGVNYTFSHDLKVKEWKDRLIESVEKSKNQQQTIMSV